MQHAALFTSTIILFCYNQSASVASKLLAKRRQKQYVHQEDTQDDYCSYEQWTHYPCVTLNNIKTSHGAYKWTSRTGCHKRMCWHVCGESAWSGLFWCYTHGTNKDWYMGCKTDGECAKKLSALSRNGERPQNVECQSICST